MPPKIKSYDTHIDPSVVEEPMTMLMNVGLVTSLSPMDFINSSRRGITMRVLSRLGEELALSLGELASILHLSLRTLQRYTPEKRLDTDASAKVLQLAELRSRGLEIFGSDTDFNVWLRTGLPVLSGQRPLDFLDTPFGFKLLDQILGRIEHGVFA